MPRGYVAGAAPGDPVHGRSDVDAAHAVELLHAARHDPDRVVLEGVHALKHAVRFGADVEVVVTPDRHALEQLLAQLAPDVGLPASTVTLDHARWRTLARREPPSPCLAVARRPPETSARRLLEHEGRLVVLEQPRHLGNLGAAIRVAAAADAGGVLVLGDADPWHPTALRGAAALQFALPVARAGSLPLTGRPTVAMDAEGTPLPQVRLPDDAVVLIGTERGGLSDALRERAGQRVAIPMRPGVASLNLATALAVVLYAGGGPVTG